MAKLLYQAVSGIVLFVGELMNAFYHMFSDNIPQISLGPVWLE